MANDKNLLILQDGVSFVQWRAALQAKLARKHVIGHVFHNISGIRPAYMPKDPRHTNSEDMNIEELTAQYLDKLEEWILQEIEAKNILISRLNQSHCPNSYEHMTAKQLYDSIAGTRQETATAPYVAALESFMEVKFRTTADEYINTFLSALQSVNNAADAFPSDNAWDVNVHSIHTGLASALFVLGTKHVEWLATWRETKVYRSDNQFAPLQSIMSSLRTTAGNRAQSTPTNMIYSATGPAHLELDPEGYCSQCRHRHKNKECFIQHPELKKRSNVNKKKGKGKKAAVPSVESDSEDSVYVASARANENLTIYDTGASHHFVSQKKFFSDLKPCHKPFRFDQAVGAASLQERGTARLKFGKTVLHLQDTLHSPNSSCNIVSAGRLERLSNIFPDFENSLLIQVQSNKPNTPVARLIRKNDVFYIFPLNLVQHTNATLTIAAPSVAKIPHANAQRWHQRLGHVGQNILKKTAECSKGLEGINMSDLTTCETCHLSKAQRFVSREPRLTPNEPLDEIFIDTVGKISTAIDGQQYAVIITDAKTRMRWALITKTKDQIAPQLVQWIEVQHHQYNKRVRAIFRDGGSEFFRIKDHCDRHGIRTEISAPDTPEQNGVSESSNKVILKNARSMLIDAKMPAKFWPWAVQHACFITNRLYCPHTRKVPLIDFLHSLNQPHRDQIDFSNLPRFGCRAYKLISPKPGKFEPRASKGWFLGFQKDTCKNFIIYHPQQAPTQGWKWIVSFTPHATFNEDVMFGDESKLGEQQPPKECCDPFPIFITPTEKSSTPLPRDNQTASQFEGEQQSHPSEEIFAESPLPESPLNDIPSPESSPIFPDPMGCDVSLPTNDCLPPLSKPSADDVPIYEESYRTLSSPILITQRQLTHPSPNMEITPFMLDVNHQPQGLSPEQDISDNPNINKQPDTQGELSAEKEELDKDDIPLDLIMTGWYPIPPIAGQKRTHSPEAEMIRTKYGRNVKKYDYSSLHHGRSAHVSSDPKTWEEAMSCTEAAQWKIAAKEEFHSLKHTGTINIIPRSKLPKGRKPMKCKWVFKKKYHADGSIERWKARCTAKGFTQRAGIDYKETFAPTPRPETGTILLALAHQFDWHRRQGDVPTAFLNPDIDIDLYMEMPRGFEKEDHVIRLRKGLYGLKQAAALWYDHAKATLAKLGLFPTVSDACLYTNKSKDLFIIMYVDDFQIMGPDLKKIEDIMKALHKRYKLKTVKTDLFLGIHINNPTENTLLLSQGLYARTLISRHGLTNCKSAASPLERLLEPNPKQCNSQERTEYNSIIGGLQYLANHTRPDIAFSVNHLARFLINPGTEHIQAALRILRYISKDPDQGITFTKSKFKPILEAYTDADFAGDPSTSRSTSGYVIMLSSGPICWRSRLQREVVLSTTEAEYLAATETCRQLRWVKSLLEETCTESRIDGAKCTKLHVDNQSAISLIKNHDNHKRSKHISLRNFYCREEYQKGRIEVVFTPTNIQLADCLTKAKSPVAIQ